MNNNKFKKSQILMLFLLALLLIITPLLSSSLRSTYLYFVINLLIIALGAEAGLLSVFFSKPPEDKKQSVAVVAKPVTMATQEDSRSEVKVINPQGGEKKARVVEKSVSDKIPVTLKADKVRKCPSMPSLFFIGGGDEANNEVPDDDEEYEYEEEEEVVGGPSGQELFTQAETFIGNFYKQLKMQREESWKRIHGFYQKAF